ncbi:MAG: DUF6514 family protein [Acetivibrionales bacterium]|jgi:hypothetical protein|nr:DUF6514 family protein [Bacillota bacterium]NLP08041.1 hypothetical protein [Clostridiaceae bacterium]HOA56273.1 DUF6514 family protein [Clostridiales bacterium]HPZ05271.1 DUF6514 family protein [Clostridiales bacterium]HQD30693.1 DUF6514 family protein [Clostridiales bacterium]
MANRMLEKCIRVDEVVGDFGETGIFDLEYYLLENETDHDYPESVQTVYGIEIVKRLDDGSVENEKFEGVYVDKSKTRKLIDLLAANTVTPVSLPYILDDLLSV